MTRPLVIVAALAENRVIGRDNALIWRLRSDLRRFREITWGKPLIMGRKTFESIGKPLPGRETIVMTRDTGWSAPGVRTAASFDEAVAIADEIAATMGAAEIVVAGGADIYDQALQRASFLRLTVVHAEPQGDARFPLYDESAFVETSRREHEAGAGDEHAFTFIDLVRADSHRPVDESATRPHLEPGTGGD
jgi:dihydrofolate reductase